MERAGTTVAACIARGEQARLFDRELTEERRPPRSTAPNGGTRRE